MDGIEQHLDFEKLRLYGRSREMTSLMDCFERSANPVGPMANYVLIEGLSGCGKTALVDAFCKEVAGRALIGRGKFDEPLSAPEPFHAILTSLNMAITTLLKTDDDVKVWRDRFKTDLGSERAFLRKYLPKLHCLMEEEENGGGGGVEGRGGGTGPSPMMTNGMEQPRRNNTSIIATRDGLLRYEKDWGFERLRLGLRSLIRCITKFETTVLALDDLQWADRDSLEVLRTVLSDTASLRRLLFIAMNRTTSQHQQPHRLFEALREKRSIRLRLGNLNTESLTEICVDLLARKASSVKPVVKVLNAITKGEPFAVVQLLRKMEQEGFLMHNPISGWEWDKDVLRDMRETQEKTPVVVERLRALDSIKQEALITLAFLGSSNFRAQCIVQANADKIRQDNEMESDQPLSATAVEEKSKLMEAVLVSLVDEGLIQTIPHRPKGEFTIHDQVREVAYNLVPNGKVRVENHLRLGRNLNLRFQDMAENGETSESTLLFKCCNQLNRGAELMTDTWERIDLVELNYQAAEEAMSRCSYARALSHVDQGIRLLGRDSWHSNFDWTKKLIVARCRLLLCCGLLEEAEVAADLVISRTHSFADQRIAYFTKLRCLEERGQKKQALQVCIGALTDMGIQMPRRAAKGHIARSVVKLKKMLRGRDENELLMLTTTSNETIHDAAHMLNRLGELADPSERADFTMLARLRILQMTLENGRVSYSALAFVSWGCLLAEMMEFEDAMFYGHVGVQISEQGPPDRYDAMARMLFYTSLAVWKYPLADCIEHMPEEIASMNEDGAIEMVHEQSSNLPRLSFFSTKPLPEVANQMWQYASLLRDYQQWHTYSVNVSYFQMVSNLLGASADIPTTLTGDYMDEITQLSEWRRTENTASLQMYFYCSTLLSFLFGDLHLADESCGRIANTIEEGPQIWFPLVVFLKGLVNLAMAGANASRKHRRQGDAAVKQLEQWTTAGCDNVKHMLEILKANQASLDPSVDPEKVKIAWDRAVETAQRSGFLFHQALAYELAGVYFRQNDQEYQAKAYLSRARAVYREWGCDSKIALMHSRYSDTLEPVSDALSVSSGRSYERLTFRRSGLY